MSATVRGPYSKTPARRGEIIAASIVVFSRSGFRSGSLREIAGLAGLSEAGLLHHFPSKAALLIAVLEHRDAQDLAAIESMPLPGLDQLQRIVELVDANTQRHGLVELHCTLSAEATSPTHPAHVYFTSRYRWVLARLTRSFEAMSQRGELVSGVDPVAAARGLIAVMDGLQVQWLLDPESVDMPRQTRDYLSPLISATF